MLENPVKPLYTYNCLFYHFKF